ncbi:TonB-dependent siderophore receptor [Xanthomonas theicola]|uniref:TonB-dependent siderophore receptor n=1 Tax=Xanthomonas theicola TaxID=56464 RepID=A0A2S6ZKY9_9XANT|nr:TonB-dependent receptor [Xanthomonas theicola]PPT92937.1 TonB-dependent siderophore receptor [Xanthomonas theicola]QNH23749.1 TonB-dependent receptor [Xanthomonas theicola]
MPFPSSPPRSFPLWSLCLLAAPAVAQHVGAADEEQLKLLDTVSVTSTRASGLNPQTVEAGSFRGADILDVPSTVNVVTRQALDLQAAAGLYDAVRNTAGVTRQQNGGDTWDQLVIRGIAVENRTNYRLNGSMPVMNFSQVPLEDKERVEVLKGASALYYGFTSPAGVINFVTKRAGATPVTTFGLTLDQYGTAVGSVDLARRFGAEQQVGVRVNAAGGALGSSLDGVDDGSRRFLSAALDWRVNDRLLLKGDVEYDHRRVTEQAAVTLPTAVGGVITLPHPVDPTRLVGPDWADFEATTRNALLRADYALADGWALTLEAGHSEMARDRRLAIFRFANNAGVASGEGAIRGNQQHHVVDSDLARAELFGSFATGPVEHELTLGASRTDKGQDAIYQSNYTIASQNLYAPRVITAVGYGARPTTPTTAALDTEDTGLYAVDRMKFGPSWQLIAGLRHSRYRSDQGSSHYAASQTTPMLAGIYKLGERLSLYTSYAEGLEEGEAAPTGTENENERLAPGISKQKELGVRWQAPNGTLVSAALFDIQRPGYYTNSNNVFTADGEQRYTGIELSTQGQLTRQLGWQTSAQWLDPRFAGIGAQYDGKLPENAARRTGSAFLTYAFDALPGLSVNGGAYYTGRRPVNDLDQAWLGDTTLLSLGGRYATALFGRRTSWQLNLDNLADKRYWAAAGTRLAAGAPRTFKFTFKVDL